MATNDSGNHDRGRVEVRGDTVTLTRGNGTRLSLRAPGINRLPMGPHLDNYHIYSDVFDMGPKRHFRGPGGLWHNLREEPAPRHILGGAWSTSNTPMEQGGRTTIGLMGTVVHYFNPRQMILINITVEEQHALYPGAVLRAVTESASNYQIITYGVGNGPFDSPNNWFSDPVWGGHAERIKRETILEETRGQRFPDPRDP